MPSPKISVIVPVYNVEKYLLRCVDSILVQTLTDFELLLIDDGSTDNSGAICDGYAAKDSRIRVFHKPNGGVSSARNLGLDNARGEWITFADSDDYVYPNWLENYNIGKIDEDIDLTIQGVWTDKPLNNLVHKLTYSLGFEGSVTDAIQRLNDSYIFGYLWIKIFRRNVIDAFNLRFDEGLNFLEDEMWMIEYLSHSQRVVAYDRIGYFYHVPNWNHKYNINLIIYKKLLDKSNEYGFEYLKRKYAKYITEVLTFNFLEKKSRYRKETIKNIKYYLVSYERYCTIQPLSRYIIFHFPWLNMVTLLYSSHVWVKAKLYNLLSQ